MKGKMKRYSENRFLRILGCFACLTMSSAGVTILGYNGGASALELTTDNINPVYQQYLDDVSAGQGSKWSIIPNKYMPSIYEDFGKGGDGLPTSYSLIDEGYGTTIKNQGTDGICWAYSTTTAMESYIKKNYGENVELSPKQLDYIIATSKYTNAITSLLKSPHELGGEGNLYASAVGLRDDSALNSESVFFAKMRANDSELASYGSFNEYNNFGSIFNYPAYTHSMSDEQVLGSKADYILDGFSIIDGRNPDVLSIVKEAVYTKGGVYVGTYAPATENCWDSTSRTVIDRGKTTCGPENGHAMVIVGWDDNYQYRDPSTNAVKTGAFLLQNSYGKSSLLRDFGLTPDNYIDLLRKSGELDGKTEAEIQSLRQEYELVYNNYDAYEYIHLGYDFNKTNTESTINFMTMDSVVKNSYERVYESTDAEVKYLDGNMVLGITSKDVNVISALSVEMLAPQSFAVPFLVGIDYDGDMKSDVTQEIDYVIGEAGQKTVKLANPVVVDGNFNLILDAHTVLNNRGEGGIEITEGIEFATTPIAYASDIDGIAVPNTGSITGESASVKYAGIVMAIVAVALPALGFVISKNKKSFHKITFERK